MKATRGVTGERTRHPTATMSPAPRHTKPRRGRCPPSRWHPSCFSLIAHDRGGFAPETFKVVEAALFRAEEVHDHVVEVEQHPAGVGIAFATARMHALLREALIHRVDDGIHLTFTCHRADHEAVSEVRDLADVEHGDIVCLTLGELINEVLHAFIGFQRTTLQCDRGECTTSPPAPSLSREGAGGEVVHSLQWPSV